MWHQYLDQGKHLLVVDDSDGDDVTARRQVGKVLRAHRASIHQLGDGVGPRVMDGEGKTGRSNPQWDPSAHVS
jgi:hypothetical protein